MIGALWRGGAAALLRMRGGRLAGDAAVIAVAQIVSKGVMYAIVIAMAQRLSPVRFGELNFVLITAALVASYLTAGLPLALPKLIVPINEDPAVPRRELAAAVLMALLVSVVALVAGPFCIHLLVPVEYRAYNGWILVAAVTASWAPLAQAALYAVQGFKEVVVPLAIGAVLLLVGALLPPARVQPQTFFTFLVASQVATAAITLRAVRRKARTDLLRPSDLGGPDGPDAAAYRAVLGIALPAMGITVIWASLSWLIARGLIAHQASPSEFNMVAIGLQWFALIMFVPLSLGQALFPRYVAMGHAGQVPLRAILLPAGGVAAALLAAAPIGMAVTPLLVRVYGGHYAFTPSFVLLVALAAAVTAPINLLSQFIIAVRGTGVWLAASIVALLTCIALVALAPPATASQAFTLMIGTNGTLLLVALLIVWRIVARPRSV